MPIQSCSGDGKPGFKWGDSGKCYIYNPQDNASRANARKKALAQGIAIGDIDINTFMQEWEQSEKVDTGSMGSGIKNPQQGYDEEDVVDYDFLEEILSELDKSLTEWFREKWVDLSRPKPGGGYESCGRSDASSGKYPKCVPASRAARMTPAQIASAIRRKRRAESTQRREGKKPIYVSTVEKQTVNVPTNPALYARIKAEAKRKFDVYPSVYANAWLVREYKKRGGGYRTVSKGDFVNKIAEDLTEDEAMLAEALVRIADKYGKFNEDGNGIWAGYESAEENDDKEIGVHCMHCVLYQGDGVCKIIEGVVEDLGKCRFAVIPDDLVNISEDEMEDETENNSEEEDDEGIDEEMLYVALLTAILNAQKSYDISSISEELATKCTEFISESFNKEKQ